MQVSSKTKNRDVKEASMKLIALIYESSGANTFKWDHSRTRPNP